MAEGHSGRLGESGKSCGSSAGREHRGPPEPGPAHDEVVVDAPGVDDLGVLGAQRGTERTGLAEVERRAGDGCVTVERDPRRVDRGELVGLHHQHVLVDRPGALAVQVEVGVVGQVDDGGGVSGRLHQHLHGVALDPIGDRRRHRPGESLVTVRAGQRQHDLVGGVPHDVPETYVEPVRPAVQAVAPVVGAHLHLAAIEHEAAAGDAVGVAAHRAADVVAARQTLGDVRVSEHHVAAYAVPTRHLEPVDRGAEGEDLDDRPGLRSDPQEGDVTPVGHLVEHAVVHEGHPAVDVSWWSVGL